MAATVEPVPYLAYNEKVYAGFEELTKKEQAPQLGLMKGVHGPYLALVSYTPRTRLERVDLAIRILVAFVLRTIRLLDCTSEQVANLCAKIIEYRTRPRPGATTELRTIAVSGQPTTTSPEAPPASQTGTQPTPAPTT